MRYYGIISFTHVIYADSHIFDQKDNVDLVLKTNIMMRDESGIVGRRMVPLLWPR
jgi:hypothetical protein